ncbi:hypothetical protein C7E15_13440 [Stenotrophomonas maltophilia]|uniref:hypothetical protein n=1 Tax=Stenotrophomonas maltophilia group TaxID=995085 RepID=UPI000D4868A9|nr:MULTISPECIES: hypothetical protein [Stenotrophomonas maltophilia group]MCF3495156.1 hypothetical protein [Stenotrophomonas maltophilia]MDQ4683105.1 hypothetical protein [Stenotrophomonas maltophilia group sp. RNC7]PSD15457.1 hypothetical protein C7E15_13440 [Stenotrophomonas maltophilia]UGB22831.1 YbjP/YqhG family protein [Stenotrophomonas maltophilia]
MRGTRMFVIAGVLLAPTAQAAPACQEPAAVARAFYEATTGNGDLLEPPAALVSPAFGKALRGERACQQREEGICTIDSDPWLDAQDGDIETPVRYSWKEASASAGQVEMRYSVWKKAYLTRLPMVRHGQGCWQVDDILTNSGRSVRKILAQPLP